MNTKLASYQSLGNTSKSRQRILDALQSNSLSRQQLALATGLRLSSVCGRVNELIKLKALRVSGYTVDPISNKSVELLTII